MLYITESARLIVTMATLYTRIYYVPWTDDRDAVTRYKLKSLVQVPFDFKAVLSFLTFLDVYNQHTTFLISCLGQ